MPNDDVRPLFDLAKNLGVAFSLGYAELTIEEKEGIVTKRRFNSSVFVNGKGDIIGKFRKIHVPGHSEKEEWRTFQHLVRMTERTLLFLYSKTSDFIYHVLRNLDYAST